MSVIALSDRGMWTMTLPHCDNRLAFDGLVDRHCLGVVLRIFLMLPVIVGLSVCGCANSLEFQKTGASNAQMKQDSAKCWAFAEKQVMTDEEKTGSVIVNGLIGGVGAAVVAAMNAEKANTPKSNYRRGHHNDCMRSRGYEVGFAKS